MLTRAKLKRGEGKLGIYNLKIQREFRKQGMDSKGGVEVFIDES